MNTAIGRIYSSIVDGREIEVVKRLSGYSIANSPPEQQEPVVIFNVVRGFPATPIRLEGMIAKSLQLTGELRPVMLWDDGVLAHWDTFGEKWELDFLRARSRFFAPRFFESFGLLHREYSRFISGAQQYRQLSSALNNFGELEWVSPVDNHTIEYQGIDIAKHARSSTIRYFKRGYIPETNEAARYFLASVINGAIAIAVAEAVYEEMRPVGLVTSHGIYSTWGPFYDYFRGKGVSTFTYGLGSFENGRIWLNHNDISVTQSGRVPAEQKKRLAERLSPKEQSRILQVLEDRSVMRNGDTRIYQAAQISPEDLDGLIDANRRTYALFPNVPWDAAVLGQAKIFPSVIQWIVETIEFFRSRPDLQLIVRFHPSEASIMKTEISLADTLNSLLPHCSKLSNVSYIAPSANVSSYELANRADAVVVYNGTLGLEMACVGKPVIAAGNPHYSEVVYPVADREEYFRLFDRLQPLEEFAIENRDRALAHAYWYVFEYHMASMPGFVPSSWGCIDLAALESLEELAPNRNAQIRMLTEYIVRNIDQR